MAAFSDATALALFFVGAFSLAGTCQTFWLASPLSRHFDVPIDGGRTWRGKRLFGDNKTFRGFVVMVPATAMSFSLIAALWPAAAADAWNLSAAEYLGLGAWAGFGFMAGELPNSFLKRQLGVAPGSVASGRIRGPLLALLDRCDSVVGAMVFVSLVVPVPIATWLLVALIGPALHGCFSAAVFVLGGKARLG